MAGTDFSHLTSDELIKGIKALDLPDYIRSKAYGVDVRETLAQMTEMTIQLGVNMGLSPDDALLWARKLQESVSQSEFDSWVATLLDGGPSIFMNTLSELQTTYPNGAPGVALVRETDPAKIYVWNGSAWEDFGAYQGIEVKDGTITKNKIADGAVTAEKTNFAKKGKNIWDGQIYNYALGGDEQIGLTLIKGSSYISIILKNVPDKTLTISQKFTTPNRFRIATFKELPEENAVADRIVLISDDRLSPFTFSTTSSENYVVVHLSSTGVLPNELMVEESGIATEYESEDKVLIDFSELQKFYNLGENTVSNKNIVNETVSAEKTTFAKRGKNLWNGKSYNFYLGGDQTIGLTVIKGDMYRSVIIENVANKTLTISQTFVTPNRFRIGAFSKFPEIGMKSNRVIEISDNRTSNYTFATNDDENYIVIYLSHEGTMPDRFMIEENSVATTYEKPNAVYIDNLNMKNEIPDNFVEIPKFSDDYTPFTSKIAYNNWSYTSAPTLYENLYTENQSYISRELLANETSGLPVYMYRFKPVLNAGKGYVERLPKILYISGTHAGEREAQIAGYRFFSDLTNHWKENDRLRFLRFNVEFVVVPLFNPYGLKNQSSENLNGRLTEQGVNLNRDFPWNWRFSTDEFNATGQKPLSQPQSAAIMELINTENFVFAVDHHTFNPFETSGFAQWYGTQNKLMNNYLSSFARNLNIDFMDYNPELSNEYSSYVHVDESAGTTSMGQIATSFVDNGIPGTIIEITPGQTELDFHTHALGHIMTWAIEEFSRNKGKIDD